MFKEVALPFEVKEMLMTGASFIYTHATWILLVLVVLYIPVTYGLLMQLTAEAAKKNNIQTKQTKKGSSGTGGKKSTGTGKRKSSSGTGKKRSGSGSTTRKTGSSSTRKSGSSTGGRKTTTAKRAIA